MSLSTELTEQLCQLKNLDIAAQSKAALQRSNKAQRQESYKQALVELNQSFEEALADVVALRFKLHPGQRRKLHFKKDRIRILKQHGINYPAIEGYETVQVLLHIVQSIVFEEAIVTAALNDAFPFWKEGFPMVQFENTYKILAADIHIHYQALIDALLTVKP